MYGWAKRENLMYQPEFVYAFCIQAQQFFKLNALDAKLLNQICKDSLASPNTQVSPRESGDVGIDGKQTASDSMVFQPPSSAMTKIAWGIH